jgi:hypothetical protein
MPHPAHSKLIIDGLTNTRCSDAVDDNSFQNNNKISTYGRMVADRTSAVQTSGDE